MNKEKLIELLSTLSTYSELDKIKYLKDNAKLIISMDETDDDVKKCKGLQYLMFLKYGNDISPNQLTANSVSKAVNFISEQIRYIPEIIKRHALFSCERFTLADVIFPDELLENPNLLGLLLNDGIYSTQYAKIKSKKCIKLVRNYILEDGIYYPIFKDIDLEKFFYKYFPIDEKYFKVNKRLFKLMDYVFDNFGLDAVLFACDCKLSYKILGQKLLKSAEIRNFLVLIGNEFKLPKSSILIKEKQEISLIRDNPKNIHILPYSSINEELLEIFLEEVKPGFEMNISLAIYISKKYRSYWNKILEKKKYDSKLLEDPNVCIYDLDTYTLRNMGINLDFYYWKERNGKDATLEEYKMELYKMGKLWYNLEKVIKLVK